MNGNFAITAQDVKTRPRWLPFAVIAAFCVLLRLATDLLPQNTVPWLLRDAGTLAVSVFVESFPFVVLGTLISTAVQLFVPQSVFFRFLPRNRTLRRAALSLLGFLLPVCECGNVPLARALLKRGFSSAEALTFVLAAPLLNPVTIITTYQAFGFENGVLVARIVGGFVIANLVGWIFSRGTAYSGVAPRFFRELTTSQAHTAAAQQTASGRKKLAQAFTLFSTELLLLTPALALGSLLAGIIQTATPAQLLQTLGSHPIYSVIFLVLLAGVVSICATVDAFFMLAFAAVFTPGAIAAFLVFGALIDIKMLLLLRTTFSTKTLAQVSVIALASTIALGFGVNAFV